MQLLQRAARLLFVLLNQARPTFQRALLLVQRFLCVAEILLRLIFLGGDLGEFAFKLGVGGLLLLQRLFKLLFLFEQANHFFAEIVFALDMDFQLFFEHFLPFCGQNILWRCHNFSSSLNCGARQLRRYTNSNP